MFWHSLSKFAPMKKLLLFALTLTFALDLSAQVPGIVTYQGRITSNGTNFTGTGNFRFALIRPGPPVVSLWSHNSTSVAGGMPTTELAVGVTNGLFTIALGDTTVAGMLAAVPASAFTNQDVRLRIWFNDGVSGVAQLTPDQRLSSSAYALMGANVPDGAILTAKLADGAVTGAKIAGGTIAAGNLAANSINSSHIIDGQVQTADLAANAVTSAKVQDGTLLGADLAEGTVGTRELANIVALGRSNTVGRLDVFTANAASNQPAIVLNGTDNSIRTYGSDGLEQIRLWGPTWGELFLFNSLANNAPAAMLTANGGGGGRLYLNNSDGVAMTRLDGLNTGGTLSMYQSDGSLGSFLSSAGSLSLYNTNGSTRAYLVGNSSGGSLSLYNANGNTGAFLDGDNGGYGLFSLRSTNGATRFQAVGGPGSGVLRLYNSSSFQTITANGDGDGDITLRQSNGTTGLWLGANNNTGGGGLSVYRDNGTFAGQITVADATRQDGFLGLTKGNGNWGLTMRGQNSSTGGGAIYLYDSAGSATIVLDSDSANEGRIWTQVLTITGGSDLSETFNVAHDEDLLPGMVVCINPERPGELALSHEAYDSTVAGVISGAGGVKTGMLMGQAGSLADGKHPVALTGRVYCYVDADAGGPVKPGDLLTTSATPGHAMKATDRDRAFGSVLGKAMTGLESGRALVLVLVTLH